MKTCPKCGFLQPPDRFCAKCGVDTENYTPPKTPLLARIFRNTYFRLFAVTLIVAVILVLFFNHTRTMDENAEYIEQANEASAPETTPSNSLQTLEDGKLARVEKTPESPANPTLAAATSPPSNIEAKLAPVYPKTPEEIPPPPPIAADLKIRLQFATVDVERLARVLETSTQINELETGSVAAIARGRSTVFTSLNVLETTEAMSLQLNKEIAFKETAVIPKNGSGFWGIITRITPTVIGKPNLTLKYELSIHLPETEGSAGAASPRVLSGVFRVPGRSTPYIAGVLPHAPPKVPRNHPLFSNSFYKVFFLEEFQRDQAEFIIVFEIEGLKDN